MEPIDLTRDVDYWLGRIRIELMRAKALFPEWPTDPVHAARVHQEERGELERAALQFTYEGLPLEKMEREAIQAAAMALRFLLYINDYVARPSPQVGEAKG